MKFLYFTVLAAAFACLPAQAEKVRFTTNMGEMVFDIDSEKAPATAANFLKYVADGFFDGLIFHRVIPNFVIQGGGFSPDFDRRPTREPIANEADNGLLNLKYTLSMARTNDPDSATSQFFINLADNAFLDKAPNNPGYAVFGTVVEGTDVVDAIAALDTIDVPPFRDVPSQAVIIESAAVVAE